MKGDGIPNIIQIPVHFMSSQNEVFVTVSVTGFNKAALGILKNESTASFQERER